MIQRNDNQAVDIFIENFKSEVTKWITLDFIENENYSILWTIKL